MNQALEPVSDSAYRAQEELLFRTAARLKGLLFYRAFSLLLLVLAAWFYHDKVAQALVFWPLLLLLLAFNVLNLYFGFIGSDCTNRPMWMVGADALGYTVLAVQTGGFASYFVYFFFLLVLYSSIWFERRLSWLAGGLAAVCVLLLYLVSGSAVAASGEKLVVVLLSLLGLTLGAAGIGSLVSETRERIVRAAMDLILANRQVVAKQAELLESEARVRLVLDTAAEAIFGVDIDGNFTFANRSCLNMLGYRSETDLLGRNAHQLVHHSRPDGSPYPQEECPMLLATAHGESAHCDVELLWRADGSSFPAEYWSHPIRRDHGIVDTVTTFIDITERKQAEEALLRLNLELEDRVERRTRQLAASNDHLKETLETLQRAQDELIRSEKLASLGSLVAGVAHELNTPLGNSLTVATTLADRTRVFMQELGSGALRRSALNEYVEQAGQATQLLTNSLFQAAELISHFKQVAVDQTSAQRRLFDLAEVVSEVVATLQPQFKQTPYAIEMALPPGVRMDSFPGPLGQVLTNLVSNALIHGFAGMDTGKIMIEACCRERSIQLRVSDNGRGISPEHLSRIFDPFFTTRLGQGGSGLGLHIVYSIVTRVLGGRIYAASAPGQGATFTLDLPLEAPAHSGNQVFDSIGVEPS